jgi:hypothetical protein
MAPPRRGSRESHKIPGGGELRVEAGIDGVEDFAFGIVGVHCVIVPVGGCAIGRIKPYSAGFADVFDRYENRRRVHTMHSKNSRPTENSDAR